MATSQPNQAQEKFLRDWIDAVHVDHVSAVAELGEDITAESKLTDSDLARGNLADANQDAEAKLSETHGGKRCLAQPKDYADAQLADGHETDRELADGDHAVSDATNGNNPLCGDALARFGANAGRVVDKWHATDRFVRFEFREAPAVGIDKPTPNSVWRFLDQVLNVFKQQIGGCDGAHGAGER